MFINFKVLSDCSGGNRFCVHVIEPISINVEIFRYKDQVTGDRGNPSGDRGVGQESKTVSLKGLPTGTHYFT